MGEKSAAPPMPQIWQHVATAVAVGSMNAYVAPSTTIAAAGRRRDRARLLRSGAQRGATNALAAAHRQTQRHATMAAQQQCSNARRNARQQCAMQGSNAQCKAALQIIAHLPLREL